MFTIRIKVSNNKRRLSIWLMFNKRSLGKTAIFSNIGFFGGETYRNLMT
jgi:hypothetical protein